MLGVWEHGSESFAQDYSCCAYFFGVYFMYILFFVHAAVTVIGPLPSDEDTVGDHETPKTGKLRKTWNSGCTLIGVPKERAT